MSCRNYKHAKLKQNDPISNALLQNATETINGFIFALFATLVICHTKNLFYNNLMN